MKLGQIVYCNLHVKTKKNKEFIIKNCIFSHPYNKKRVDLFYSDMNDRRLIKQTPFKEDLKIVNVDIIEYLGFKHKGSGYTEVQKNDNNKRNSLGIYE